MTASDSRSKGAGVPVADDPAYRRRWLVLTVVLVADVMDLVDSTIANLAGPSIRADLGGGQSSLQWVLAAYTLAFSIGLITSGRIGDIVGRRRMFLAGMAGFTLASVACGLAPGITFLVLARVAQGLCGAVMIPQGFAMVKVSFPPSEIQKAFIPFGPALGLSSVIAPVLGGVLITADVGGTGWRSVFLINVPVGVLGLLLGRHCLPQARETVSAVRVDPVGILLLTVASALAIYPLVQGREAGWPAWTFGMLAAAALVFVLFVVRERASSHPVVESSLFGHRGFRGGLLVIAAFFTAVSGVMLTVNLFFQLGLGYRPFDAGIAMIPMAVGISVGAGVSGGYLGPRFGRRVLLLGTAVSAAGSLWLWATIDADGLRAGTAALAPSLACLGTGMGLVFAPLFDIIIADLGEHEVGTGSGVLNAVQQYAATVGVAVLGTVFFGAVPAHGFDGATKTVALLSIGAFAAAALGVTTLPRHARAGGGH